MKQCFEHVIKEVLPDSIAEEMEIEPGDVLLEINEQKIKDVFDYRFLIKDEYIEVLIRKPDGEEWLLEIEKDFDDDLGIEFENGLMSEYKSCTNKCIFCFIDQMPPGMRETLYFKDDDSRLSFLQGNYITMTNMTDEDFDRIIRMQLAPINISVQTMNPQLRCKMLNNRFAGDKLKYLDKLYEGHVEMNGQIVCCKGVNDGEELKRSIEELMKYLPFMRSVSVVPAGITKYREGLYPLELFTKDEAAQVIDLIEGYQQKCYEEYGLHFIHASDEWYILAGRPFPEEERYDGYIQLENGVGMMRLLMTEFEDAWNNLLSDKEICRKLEKVHRSVTIATGRLPYPTLKEFAEKITGRFPNIQVNVAAIRNDFFGETITVSGLVTGQDLLAQLSERENLGETVLIPSSMLRSGEQVFLDDMTVAELSEKLGVKVKATECSGSHFLESIFNPDYEMTRNNENFVYVKAYDN
jgi:putative radical SAM enzyme (TIGR03279 family)